MCMIYVVNQIIFLQEHWLLPNEMDFLNNIHDEFVG